MVDEFIRVITDPAHVAAEGAFILTEAAIGWLIVRPLLKRRDARLAARIHQDVEECAGHYEDEPVYERTVIFR